MPYHESTVSFTAHTLFESDGFQVIDYRCEAGVHPPGREEASACHSVVLVRRGVFLRTLGRETRLADPNRVLFFNEGEAYRVGHPVEGGDECTVVELSSELAREVVSRHSPRDAERSRGPFRRDDGPSSLRAWDLHYELLGAVRRGAARLALEDLALELADEALRMGYAWESNEPRGAVATPRRHRDLVEAAKLRLNEELESPPTLSRLARDLGCSAFHLSRTFSRTVGLPLRRYLGLLRVRAAAARLADGAADLTQLALELGFADHSHFTNTFRRTWGVAPSAFRSRLRPAPSHLS